MAGEPPVIKWRALLGAALVTTAAFGVLFAYRAAGDPPRDRYLVITSHVETGERLTSESLGTVAIDLPSSVGAMSEEQADEAVGRLASHALQPSTLLTDGDLVDGRRFENSGETEVTVSLDPERTPVSELAAGDWVAILATSDSGTRVVSPSARITTVDTEDSTGSIGSAAGLRLTLAVPDMDSATGIVDAAVTEELSVAVGAPGTMDAQDQP